MEDSGREQNWGPRGKPQVRRCFLSQQLVKGVPVETAVTPDGFSEHPCTSISSSPCLESPRKGWETPLVTGRLLSFSDREYPEMSPRQGTGKHSFQNTRCIIFSCFTQEGASLDTRTQRRLCVQSQGWVGGGRRGVRVGWEGGAAAYLTAYFFVCFIQFLQRVQQFLWGENVRGSWGGGCRKDSECRPSLSHFPFLPFPSSRSGHAPHPPPRGYGEGNSWKQGGDRVEVSEGQGGWGWGGHVTTGPGDTLRGLWVNIQSSGSGKVPGCIKG